MLLSLLRIKANVVSVLFFLDERFAIDISRTSCFSMPLLV